MVSHIYSYYVLKPKENIALYFPFTDVMLNQALTSWVSENCTVMETNEEKKTYSNMTTMVPWNKLKLF
jgi:hypothetical protein